MQGLASNEIVVLKTQVSDNTALKVDGNHTQVGPWLKDQFYGYFEVKWNNFKLGSDFQPSIHNDS